MVFAAARSGDDGRCTVSDAAQGLPLFVFGTLRDAEVREVVLARALDAGGVRNAVLPDHDALMLPDESYPVLAAMPGRSLAGLLLELDAADLERVAFYEGDEYVFAPVRVRDDAGVLLPALVCADRLSRAGARSAWTFEAWQRLHKRRFLPRIRRYMAVFGSMSSAEADLLWQASRDPR